MTIKKVRVLTTIIALSVAVSASACAEHKGPAQKAGAKLDHASDKVSDTVNPKGPVEKTGRAIDRATGS